MATTYSLGCYDCDGNHLHDGIPIGQRKIRLFDPNNDPRYKSLLPLPCEITMYAPDIGLTHLSFARGYKPKAEDKYVTGTSGQKFQRHTMIIEVAAREWHDMTISARCFGRDPSINKASAPYVDTPRAHMVASSISMGCQQAGDIIKKRKFIKQVIFLTSESAICEGVQKVFDWLRGGFPKTLKDGLSEMDFKLMHFNISNLEKKGIEVLFWLVKPEFITEPHFDAICFREQALGISRPEGAPCTCGRCIAEKQHRELSFAKRGTEPCPCEPCKALVAKYGHLHKGEKFPFTNNAGLNIDVTMEVDGTNAPKEVPTADQEKTDQEKAGQENAGEEKTGE